jgi:hypothetical protein
MNDELGGAQPAGKAQVKPLLIVLALPFLFGGCSPASDLDVRSYNSCLMRHSQDAVVCEGPRQAYEVGPSILQAKSTAAVAVFPTR